MAFKHFEDVGAVDRITAAQQAAELECGCLQGV
jgi:hypothetical protein